MQLIMQSMSIYFDLIYFEEILLPGRVKIQLIKRVFKSVHTLRFKRVEVFKYKDMKCWF